MYDKASLNTLYIFRELKINLTSVVTLYVTSWVSSNYVLGLFYMQVQFIYTLLIMLGL